MPETKRPLKVFLCHASADKPKVRELYRTLKRRGVQPWLDSENLIPGQNWEVEIPKALLSSDAIIICLTPNSIDKEGYIQKEIKFALDKALEMPEGRIFIIPAKLEECDLPFSLRQYQAVNLYEKEGYARLMKALKLRASQLERNTVELPKEGEIIPEIRKVVEEKKSVRPEQEKLEPKTFESSRESPLQNVDIDDLNGTGGKNVIKVPLKWKPEIEISTMEKSQPRYAKSPRKPNTAIIVALIGLVGTIIAALLGSPLIEKWFSLVPASTEIATATITWTPRSIILTKTIEPSQTATKIFAPSATPTKSSTSTPALGSGSTMIGKDGMTLLYVSAGNFTMGKANGTADVRPVHTVYLDAFWIDRTDVTNKMYALCVDADICQRPKDIGTSTHAIYYGSSQFDNYPVVSVDWDMAKTYCEFAGRRLPTEAEWEKAARGTDGRTYPWGNDEPNNNLLNYNRVLGDTTEVGKYPNGASPYGAFDMAGNVWQWVADWYSDTYYQSSPSSNPLGPDSGQYRVLRGGSWYENNVRVRSFVREWGNTTLSSNVFGFRCASNVTP